MKNNTRVKKCKNGQWKSWGNLIESGRSKALFHRIMFHNSHQTLKLKLTTTEDPFVSNGKATFVYYFQGDSNDLCSEPSFNRENSIILHPTLTLIQEESEDVGRESIQGYTATRNQYSQSCKILHVVLKFYFTR